MNVVDKTDLEMKFQLCFRNVAKNPYVVAKHMDEHCKYISPLVREINWKLGRIPE